MSKHPKVIISRKQGERLVLVGEGKCLELPNTGSRFIGWIDRKDRPERKDTLITSTVVRVGTLKDGSILFETKSGSKYHVEIL